MANARPTKKEGTQAEADIFAAFKNLPAVMEQDLSKVVLAISVGVERHEGKYLLSTLLLLEKYKDKFKKVDILVGGVLQRWNFWNFSKPLTDKQLEKLLKDIPSDVREEDVPAILAQKFYRYAKQAEDDYILKNSGTCLEVLTSGLRVNFIPWETMVPVNTTQSLPSNYDSYYATLKEKCEQDEENRIAFANTSERVLMSNKYSSIIWEEINRLKAVNSTLNNFTDEQWKNIINACSYHYLLEECPLLFAELPYNGGYQAIIYPGDMTDAFKTSQRIFAKPILWLEVEHNDIMPRERLSRGVLVPGDSSKIQRSTSALNRSPSPLSDPLPLRKRSSSTLRKPNSARLFTQPAEKLVYANSAQRLTPVPVSNLDQEKLLPSGNSNNSRQESTPPQPFLPSNNANSAQKPTPTPVSNLDQEQLLGSDNSNNSKEESTPSAIPAQSPSGKGARRMDLKIDTTALSSYIAYNNVTSCYTSGSDNEDFCYGYTPTAVDKHIQVTDNESAISQSSSPGIGDCQTASHRPRDESSIKPVHGSHSFDSLTKNGRMSQFGTVRMEYSPPGSREISSASGSIELDSSNVENPRRLAP